MKAEKLCCPQCNDEFVDAKEAVAHFKDTGHPIELRIDGKVIGPVL